MRFIDLFSGIGGFRRGMELAEYMSDNAGMSKRWWLEKLQSEVEEKNEIN